MRRTVILAATLAALCAGQASAQGLIRGHIDNGLNKIESVFGENTPDQQIRALTDEINLLDVETKRLLAVVEAKRQQREAAAANLLALGIEPPIPVILTPVPVPAEDGQPPRTCLLSFNGTPLHCW